MRIDDGLVSSCPTFLHLVGLCYLNLGECWFWEGMELRGGNSSGGGKARLGGRWGLTMGECKFIARPGGGGGGECN